jgi:hypothetical protein
MLRDKGLALFDFLAVCDADDIPGAPLTGDCEGVFGGAELLFHHTSVSSRNAANARE